MNLTDQFRHSLIKYLPDFQLTLTDDQIKQCVSHYEMLLKWNRKMSLTTVTAPDEAARFHYCESMFASQFLPTDIAIADLGSGAGFPGVPLGIINADRPVILVESHGKKAIFLKECMRLLGLKNVKVETNRFQNLDLSGMIWASRAIETLDSILGDLFGSDQPSALAIFTTDAIKEKVAEIDLSTWKTSFHPIPLSKNRQLIIAKRV